MSRQVELSLTFALASISATVFLLLRCQGVGRPFARSGRWWAVSVIGLTGIVSTLAAGVTMYVVQGVPILVGLVAPSGLWLGFLRQRGDGRRGPAHEISTLWLATLLERLHQAMAEDRLTWCEKRVDEAWSSYELSLAANHYYEAIGQRLSSEEHRRERVHARLQAIEKRLDLAFLLEDGASKSKIMTAMNGSRVTRQPRYERYAKDPAKLNDILRHDAESDLLRLLGSAYRCGFYRLDPFSPPRRDTFLEDASAERGRPHP
jgi:hypothetical protein